MRPRPLEVPKQIPIRAAGVEESVRQDRQSVERSFFVDGPGQARHHAVVRGQPNRVKRHGPKWVPEDAVKQPAAWPVHLGDEPEPPFGFVWRGSRTKLGEL